jgi:hypothetical protein
MLFACLLTLLVIFTSPAFAETQTIIFEATDSMGDGETPSFAEAMVLPFCERLTRYQAGRLRK